MLGISIHSMASILFRIPSVIFSFLGGKYLVNFLACARCFASQLECHLLCPFLNSEAQTVFNNQSGRQ